MEPVYRPVIGAARAVLAVMSWRVSTTGAHHLPATGPAVVATNHIGYLDFVFVGYAARERKRLVRFMAKKEVFEHRISGPLMRGMKHIPADRFGDTGEVVRLAVEALGRGEVLGMFPEGTISRSFVPDEGKTGAARIAMEAGVPLIPGAVWGTQRILTKGRPRNFQRNIDITVDLAPPVEYVRGDDPGVVTKQLMAVIAELVDRAQRRYAQQPSGSDDTWWLPAHLGGTAPTVEESKAMAGRERESRRRAAGR